MKIKRGSTEYKNIHSQLRRKRGKASDNLCEENCGNFAKEWAWIHNTDPFNLDNYAAMCQSCHSKYDFQDGRLPQLVKCGENNGRAKFSLEEILKIREDYAKSDTSHRKLAEKYKTSRSHIARIINGVSWREGANNSKVSAKADNMRKAETGKKMRAF